MEVFMTEEYYITIGRLAKLAGFGIETVRIYECQGLIAPPLCTESSYRMRDSG
jgi:DNA-binding transcriptional MerR regulator